MRLDPHVHTIYSGKSTIYPLHGLLRESYNSPEGVYRRAKARGMDLVAITDHDRIDGALTLADRPDVLVGCEVTAEFPHDRVRVHLGVLDITEAQHRVIERLRRDVGELLPYLQSEGIFTILNHVASRINGLITASHIAAIMPWVDALEIQNGSRLPSQNRTAAALASACGKIGIGGSDSHTGCSIGHTWVEVPGATTKAEFMAGLKAGRVRVGGRHGSYLRMASDIMRITGNFLRDRSEQLIEQPLSPKRQAILLGGLLGLPLVPVALSVALVHFVLEARFNRALLFDLVAQPAAARVPEPVS